MCKYYCSHVFLFIFYFIWFWSELVITHKDVFVKNNFVDIVKM